MKNWRELHHLGLSYRRAIELLWVSARDAIFWDSPREKIQEDKIAREMQVINAAYAIAKLKFEGKNRKISNERYFEHLRETANIIIQREITPKVSIYQVALALLHDIIEDTDMTPEALELALGNKEVSPWLAQRLAQWVSDLSKKDWREFVQSSIDREFISSFESSEPIPIAEEDVDGKEWFILDWFGTEPKNHNEHKKYKNIRTEAKRLRDIEYAQRLRTLDNETLNIKFADRIHNLRTQWDPNDTEQVRKKVKETKEIYLPLAQERNPRAYEAMIREIEILERQLWYEGETTQAIDTTKDSTIKTLEVE